MSLRQQIECEHHLSAVSGLKGLYLFVNRFFLHPECTYTGKDFPNA